MGKFGNIKDQILGLLGTVQGNGSFVTSGTKGITLPGLHIEDVGEIGMPVAPVQIEQMVASSTKAPFGKGRKTITDVNVRSAWELDAGQLSFRNKEWQLFIDKVLEKVKEGLGIEDNPISASLYKLLVYEKGDFFLSHKDSEKESGMFGTLIIGLPTTYTGGELHVRFDGSEEIIDFSEPSGNYKIPFAAFFADCEHELKPVTSGYRVVLVYNLLQTSGLQNPGMTRISEKVDEMAELLQSLSGDIQDRPKAVLLDHQYTPANFSLNSLKLHDGPRARLLLEAARAAGWFAVLGLVTHYKMGELEGMDYDYEYSRGYRNKYSEDSGDGTMGEVYEEYTTIEHWNSEDVPDLGRIEVSIKDLITAFKIGEGEPVDQEEEGFTGNAGMTMEYWYHYGAVILWPQSKHLQLLSQAPVQVRLQWLTYYSLNWDQPNLQAAEMSKQIIANFLANGSMESHHGMGDFSVVAEILIKLNDGQFIVNECKPLLTVVFNQIQIHSWTVLLQNFDATLFTPVFYEVANKDNVYSIRHVTEILTSLATLNSLDETSTHQFLHYHLDKVPTYLSHIVLSKLKDDKVYSYDPGQKRKEAIIGILDSVMALSQLKEQDPEWLGRTYDMITRSLSRKYVNDFLIFIVMGGEGVLRERLRQLCISDLRQRTAVRPQPQENWKRELPATKSDKEIWNLLRPFLESPHNQVFEYRKAQAYRSQMEAAIKRVTIDLKMETVKRSSPHILKLTKTQAAYERALKNWQDDKAILESLEHGN